MLIIHQKAQNVKGWLAGADATDVSAANDWREVCSIIRIANGVDGITFVVVTNDASCSGANASGVVGAIAHGGSVTIVATAGDSAGWVNSDGKIGGGIGGVGFGRNTINIR